MVDELKKLYGEFEKFTWSSYIYSLPAVARDIASDTMTKKPHERLARWAHLYFNESVFDLSQNSTATKELLDSRDSVEHLSDILRNFSKLISRYSTLHQNFKDLYTDLGPFPEDYMARYERGVDTYNEFLRMLKIFVVNYKNIAESWFKRVDYLEKIKR